jgi:hypothetical protein
MHDVPIASLRESENPVVCLREITGIRIFFSKSRRIEIHAARGKVIRFPQDFFRPLPIGNVLSLQRKPTGRASAPGAAGTHRHCLRQTQGVCAREPRDEAIEDRRHSLDCFAVARNDGGVNARPITVARNDGRRNARFAQNAGRAMCQ